MIKDAISAFTDRLSQMAPLSKDDRQAVAALPCSIETVPAHYTLVREADEPGNCCVLLRGYACRHKSTSEGARQIVSFQSPGDIVDVQSLALPRADHSVETISEATVGWIASSGLKKLQAARPAIAEALWRQVLVEASIFREWVLNVGRRNAGARVAHLLCEFFARREAAGLSSPERFDLPMTQEVIADATGLTVVHVNRTLGALTAGRLISRSGREYRINDWPRMQKAADFDAAYLHQELESPVLR